MIYLPLIVGSLCDQMNKYKDSLDDYDDEHEETLQQFFKMFKRYNYGCEMEIRI